MICFALQGRPGGSVLKGKAAVIPVRGAVSWRVGREVKV
jgi:hypothetical protein